MTNLVEKYGNEWFDSKFRSSLFMYEDDVHAVDSALRTNVLCYRIRYNPETKEVVRTESRVPKSFFTDVSKFAAPALGWRTLDQGRYLAYLNRNNNSYRRGLSPNNLVVAESALTTMLRRRYAYSHRPTHDALGFTALRPSFLSLAEGLEKMRAGEIMSFAISPVIAVVPGADAFNIMFKNKVAGTVTPEGNMAFHIPEMNSYMEIANEERG